jgi:hypothetical protein
MDNEGRDRRDWPASDSPGEPRAEGDEATRPAGEPAPDEPAPDEPAAADPTRDEPAGAPIDWATTEPPQPPEDPVDEAAAAEMEAAPATSTEGDVPAPAPDETRPWPTEPPEAGSASPDAWPTSAPERSDAPDEASSEPPETESTWPSSDAGSVEPPSTPAAPEWTATDPRGDAIDAAPPPPSEVEAHAPMVEPDADADADRASMLAGAAAASAAGSAPAVPDAESAIGESTRCPRCGTENRAGLAFCRECGQRLVAAGVAKTVERPGAPEGSQACPRCGTHNRAGVAFCQNCGANLRGTAPGYVPPAVAGTGETVGAASERSGAVLGPVVLLIGLIGLATGYLLPFLYGDGSLFDRAFGAGGYGPAFWAGYPEVGAGIADQAYFGLAAPVPLLGVLLLVLAVAGFARARPGGLQTVGLVIALIWSVGLAVLFLLVEVGGNWGGDLVGVLRALTPAGIIFFLASLIVLIGTLTRFGRS